MDVDAQDTPHGQEPLSDEAHFALRAVLARCEEVASAVRAGDQRYGGMSRAEQAAFVRNAAALLRRVEAFAGYGAHVLEWLIGNRDGVLTPREIATAPIPLPRKRWTPTARALTALAALVTAGAALLREWFAGRR